MKRVKSEYARTKEVAKRLCKPSWVNRYHKGDEDAAALALAEEHGFSGRVYYLRQLCQILADYPEEDEFEDAVKEYHEYGLRLMAETLEHCEITNNPELKKYDAPYSDAKVGDCYRQAYYYATDVAPAGALLVHGLIGEGKSSPVFVGHGWVELPGDVVYDGVLQRFYDKKGYYEQRNAQPTKTYPVKEVIWLMARNHNFGPWHD